jgi:hypothetical protein
VVINAVKVASLTEATAVGENVGSSVGESVKAGDRVGSKVGANVVVGDRVGSKVGANVVVGYEVAGKRVVVGDKVMGGDRVFMRNLVGLLVGDMGAEVGLKVLRCLAPSFCFPCSLRPSLVAKEAVT